MVSPDPKSLEALLGIELSTALDRSVESSLRSLNSLRQAVFEYTRSEKLSGLPVEKIIGSVLTLLATAENTRPNHTASEAIRDQQLSRQLAAWCVEDYNIA